MGEDSIAVEDKFEFPECWNSDIRMSALFAPFRSKSVNPTDYNSKMEFWTSLIENWLKYNKCPLVEISSLKNSFSRKGSVPACLEEVLLYLRSEGDLVNKDDFMEFDENWKSWAVKMLVTKPLKWTFSAVKSTIIKDDEQKKIYYVHMPVVKYLSEELQKNVLMSFQGKIINFEDLMQMGYEVSENLSIILHFMQKQGTLAINQENDFKLLKFSINVMKPVKITETDLKIYNLEKQQKLLEENITKLECEKNAALKETKKHLAAKNRNLAKISLRRKKLLESTMEKRVLMLENIQGIFHQIEQVKLDSQVIECYQTGIATLKQIFKEIGLNEVVVTDTMNELQEMLNDGKDIEKALAAPVNSESEKDLEDELNELLLKEIPEVPRDELPIMADEENKSKETNDIRLRLEALSV